jgi:hypothetical protein
MSDQPGVPMPPPPPHSPFQPYPGGPPEWAAPTRTMAGWALGLSCIPCALSLVVSLVLSIIVLTGRGRHAGRKLAIGALAMIGLWVVVLVVIVVIALATGAERNGAGDVVNRGEIDVSDVVPGDCLQLPDDEAVYSVEAVPCTAAHEAETYADFRLEGDKYPGERRVWRIAQAGCQQRFERFVGTPVDSSRLEIFIFYPQESSWQLHHDRTVTCLLTLPDDRPVKGTLRDSKR